MNLQTPFSYSRIALITCFIASIGDFVTTTLLGIVYKNYNSLTDSQSYLGTFDSPVAVYMTTWEILLGLLLVTCAYSLYRTGFFKTRLEKLVVWLVAIYAFGEGIGSGMFPFNHFHGALTPTGWIHSIFSGVGITAMVILSLVLPIIFSRKNHPRLNRVFLLSAMTGMVFIILCLFSRFDFLRFVGLWQRLYLAAYYFMLITLTLYVTKAAGERFNTASKVSLQFHRFP